MNEYSESIKYKLITQFNVGRFYPEITIKQQDFLPFSQYIAPLFTQLSKLNWLSWDYAIRSRAVNAAAVIYN
jgi:hypothetical protein